MHFTYLFDPLCGWCYGASPVLERLAAMEGVVVELAPSGLFAGEGARPMDGAFAAYAWRNDQRIARLTGQVFSEVYRSRILEPGKGIFDSAPSTLGVVAVGMTEPGREIEALKRLQQARYVEGQDNADLKVVADILDAAGFAEASARIRNPDDALLEAYRHRVARAREEMRIFGVNGVPALVVEDSRGRRLLPSQILYSDLNHLAEHLQAA